MSVILNKLNHYSAYTAQDIEDIKAYVETKNDDEPVFPEGFTNRQKRRFIEKFGNHFIVENNLLYYNPNPSLKLEAVPPELREQKLRLIYDNVEKGQGLGLRMFYYQVCNHYIGITREVTSQFLRKQGNYVLNRSYIKAVNQPIIALCPNERWGIDLIDFNFYLRDNANDAANNNDGYRFVLNCIDYFSKKLFVKPLRGYYCKCYECYLC